MGNAVLTKAADSFEMTIQVDTAEDNAQKALALNNEKINLILSKLGDLFLKPQVDFSTGYFSINPIYANVKRHNSYYNQVEEQVITGYQVTNSISIRTDKLQLVGDIIDTANKGGATNIHSLSFGLRDSSVFRIEAVQAAVKNAIEEANAVAAAAKMQIGKIISIDTNGGGGLVYDNINAGDGFRGMMMAKGESFGDAPRIDPRDVKIHASVSVTFLLQ